MRYKRWHAEMNSPAHKDHLDGAATGILLACRLLWRFQPVLVKTALPELPPIFQAAKKAAKKRVAYAEGEEERVLRAAQIVVDEGIARPTLIGREAAVCYQVALSAVVLPLLPLTLGESWA